MLTEWLLLALGGLLTLGTGVFVAAEFSLITLDRPDVEREAASGSRSAGSVLKGLRTLSTQLSGAQVGITLTTLLVGYLVEPSLSRLLEGAAHRRRDPRGRGRPGVDRPRHVPRHHRVDAARRAGPQEPGDLGADGHGALVGAAAARLHLGGDAADRGAQRQRQQDPAQRRHRAARGAHQRPLEHRAGLPGQAVGRGRDARRGHRDAAHPLAGLLPAHRRRRDDRPAADALPAARRSPRRT